MDVIVMAATLNTLARDASNAFIAAQDGVYTEPSWHDLEEATEFAYRNLVGETASAQLEANTLAAVKEALGSYCQWLALRKLS